MQRRNFTRTAEEAGLHDSLGEIDRPSLEQTQKTVEWLSARMKNVGMSLETIITGVEEKALGFMILPDSYWDDSNTLTHSWTGLGWT